MGRIYDHLSEEFGEKNIFTDVYSIPMGDDFRETILEWISQCDYMLVIIGRNWANLDPISNKSSLFQEKDFIRIEIEEASRLNKKILPILVSDSKMPEEKDLPGSIHFLIYINSLKIRSGSDLEEILLTYIKSLRKKEIIVFCFLHLFFYLHSFFVTKVIYQRERLP